MNTKTSKRILAMLLAVAMVFSNLPGYSLALEAAATDTSSSSSDSAVVTTDTSSSTTSTSTEVEAQRIADIKEIVNMHLEYGYAAFGNSVYTYETEPDMDATDGYTEAGALSEQSLQEGLDTLKMVRYLAGVWWEDTEFTEEANEYAQLAAYVNALNDEMSHTPGQPDEMDDDLYEDAASATLRSNLASGCTTPAASILLWIQDTGDSNIDNVGHRRWLLAEKRTDYGLGAATNASGTTYSAAFVQSTCDTSVDEYVAWPSAGVFPIQYFVNEWSNWETETAKTVWSISLGDDYDTAELENIEITLTRTATNGLVTTWVINDDTAYNSDYSSYSNSSIMHLNTNDDTYGMTNTITFRPDLDTIGAIADGDVFTVTITGLTTNNGSNDATIEYEVDFFDLESAVEEYAPKSTVTFNVTDATDGVALTDATIQITSDATGDTIKYAELTSTDGVYTAELQNDTTYTYSILKNHYITETGTIVLTDSDQTITADVSEGSYFLYVSASCGTTTLDGVSIIIDGVSYAADYYKYAVYAYTASEIGKTVSYSVSVDGYSTATGEITLTAPANGNTNYQTISLDAYNYVNFVVTNGGVPVDSAEIVIGTPDDENTLNYTTDSLGEYALRWTALSTYTRTYTITSGDASKSGSFTITAYTPETQNICVDLTNGLLTTITDFDLTDYVTTPVVGETPVTTFTADQYTGTITWSGNPTVFETDTVYNATVTLTATSSEGYTLTGIAANSFTHDDAALIVNNADSKRVVIMFSATAEKELTGIEITTPPSTTEYTYGDDFDTTEMVVTATYDDGSTEVVTDYIVTDGDDLAVGTTYVTISYGGKTTTQDISVSKADQSITVNSIDDKPYGDGSFSLSVSDTSGTGEVTYYSSNSNVISITDSTATVVGVGEATITASIAEDGNYNAARDNVGVTVTVSAAAITDTTTATQTATYTGSAIGITGASGTLAVGDGAATVTYDTDVATSYTDVGKYEIGYTLSGANHESVTGTITFTITQATQAAPETATGGYTVSTTDSDTFVYTITAIDGAEYSMDGETWQTSNVFDKLTPGETYTFYVRYAATDNYTASDATSYEHTLSKFAQDISYQDDAVTTTYGDDSFTNTLTKNSVYGTVTYASSNPAVATVDADGEVTIVGAGEATITATVASTATYNSDDASYTLTVSEKSVAVSWSAETSYTYTGSTLTAPTASITGVNSDGTIALTVTEDNNKTFMDVGDYSFTASTTNGNYTLTNTTTTATIVQATNSATVSLADWTYGETASTPSFSATFGTEASYTYSTSEAGTFTSTMPTNAGTYYVKATVAGTTNYAEATSSAVAFTIAKATDVVTFTESSDSFTYGSTIMFAASATSGTAISFGYSTEENGDYTETAPSTVGTYYIKATVADSNNYNGASATYSFSITKASYDDQTASGTAKYGTSGTVDLSSLLAGIDGVSFGDPTTAGDTRNALSAYSTNTTDLSLGFTFADDSEYAGKDVTVTIPVSSTNYADFDIVVTLTVAAKDTQSITLASIDGKTYGNESFGLSASGYSGKGTITFTSSDESVISINGTTATIVGAGTATITVTIAEDDTYATASASQSVTVSKATPSITTDPTASGITYGQTLADSTLSGAASVDGTFTWDTDTTYAPTVSESGNGYAVIFTPDSDNYATVHTSATVSVAKANQTISMDAIASKTYGDDDFTLAATLSVGDGAVSYASDDTNVISISGTTATIEGAGTTTITATAAETDNYNEATYKVTVTVAKAEQTITLTAIGEKAYDSDAFTLEATLSVGDGAISYTSSDENVIKISGTTATIVGTGEATITATAAETDNYNSATASETVTVAKASQTLTLTTIGAKTYGDGSFTLSTGTTTGSGAVSYASSDTSVISIGEDGTTATIVGAGEATITATIAADDDYASATATETVTVAKADDVVTFTEPSSSFTYGDDITFIASATSNGTITFTYTQNDTAVIPNTVGEYTVTATVADSDNYNGASATHTFSITKASFTAATTATGSAKYGNTGSVDLSAWASFAGASFGAVTASGNTDVLSGDYSISDGKLTFAFADNEDNVGETVTFTTVVSSTNYTDFTLTVTVTVDAKYVATVSADTFTKVYDGTEVTVSDLTTSAIYDDAAVAGTWAFAEGTSTIKDVVDDTYGLVFTPDDGDNYATVNTTVSISITQAAITIAADAQEITVGYDLPTFTYTVTGLADGEALSTEPSITCTAEDGNTIGSYAITVVGAAASDNYTISYTNATLTINDKVTPDVSITTIGSKTYGDTITLGVTGYAGTGAITYTSSNPDVIAIDGDTATIVGAGEATITVDIAEDADYYEATASETVTVSPATITITADSQSASVGDDEPTYTYTVTGLIGDETLTAAPSAVTCATADMTSAGAYTITVSQDAEASDNYTIVYVDGTLTVTKVSSSSSSSSSSSVDITTDVTIEETVVETTTTTTTSTSTNTTTTDSDTSTQTDTTVEETASVSVAVGSVTNDSGETVVELSDDVISDAIDEVLAAAAETDASETEIVLAVASDASVADMLTNISLVLSEESVSALVDAEITQLTIESASVSITLDATTLQTMAQTLGGSISIIATDITTDVALTDDVLAIVGDNPVFSFSIVDEAGNTVGDFNGGSVTVSIPYTLGAGESAENIVVYYIDNDGNLAEAMATTYDEAAELAIFTTTHFSSFAVVHLATADDAVTDSADATTDTATDSAQDTAATESSSSGGSTTVVLVVVLFFIVLIAGGVYIVLKKRNQETD